MMIDRLIEAIREKENPTVVGLDPRIGQIPRHVLESCFQEYGKSPRAVAEAFGVFNREIIDSVCDLVPAVKPQIAMYEEYGPEGVETFLKTVQYAKAKGLIVIGDIKRGDIASTGEAYANGHIGRTEIDGESFEIFGEDFATISPYLGWDSVDVFINNCQKYQKGVFVLVKTSNKGSGDIQDLDVGGMPLYEKVGQYVEEWGKGLIGKYGFSSVGAVVGATYPKQAKALREKMPHTFFLIPGYGAQGGKAEDLAVCFKNGLGGIVNSSRGITAAYQNEKYGRFGQDFGKAARQAVMDMKDDLRRCFL